ncbi:hypothetical protein DICPUDRAFT_154094 [Dictyostelium purpureum]|uniref:Uncharacterized protein n=1 Tax=Dictyostelium purpureum TaxID=5786 RepID=F0ZQK1_DICPU|nr:uncharacterized protein DICPUDRAFT_154094 [Dictyostelium purpureum]EGC33766.1 hypothetical protein DICPUDRAFT_154094 [Dictyostelium purpureum]|eukprot:XP_003289691.1 hypothetical protein DICPUDRAFT_154094 [Dictyostelium purpureum]
MRFILLLLSVILLKFVSASVPAYGIWNGEENDVIIGKLDYSDSPSYSKIFSLENSTLVSSNDNPLSTINRLTNTIYFITKNDANQDSLYLYSFDFESNQVQMVLEYLSSDLQIHAIESAQTTNDLDLLIVYKSKIYQSQNYFVGSLSIQYGVPALYGPVTGNFLSATFNTDSQTIDVFSASLNSNSLFITSYALFGSSKATQLKSSSNVKSGSLLTYSSSLSSLFSIANVNSKPSIINIKDGEISVLDWMNNNNPKQVQQYSSMVFKYSSAYLSVTYSDGTFGLHVLNNYGLIATIQTPFLLNNYWFI